MNLVRPIEPKALSLDASSDLFEVFYIFSENQSISLSYKDQVADTQKIQCYTFSSLTVGYCDDAVLSISNSKSKYDRLDADTLMMIDAANQEYNINYTRAVNNIFFDEYVFYIGLSENSFDWLSPIEELQVGFIANLSYQGSRIGDLVTNEIKRLPQRTEFELYKLGFNFYNNINITQKLKYFYDLDMVLIKTDNYQEYKSTPTNNIKLKTGFLYQINDLNISIAGSLYKNNLFGFEDISFNQRSEHHFDSAFGSIDIALKYSF